MPNGTRANRNDASTRLQNYPFVVHDRCDSGGGVRSPYGIFRNSLFFSSFWQFQAVEYGICRPSPSIRQIAIERFRRWASISSACLRPYNFVIS